LGKGTDGGTKGRSCAYPGCHSGCLEEEARPRSRDNLHQKKAKKSMKLFWALICLLIATALADFDKVISNIH
jgi:hypothetical protein